MLVVAIVLLHFVQLVVCFQDTSKVLVGLYAESLCGDCVAFSSGLMNEAYNKVALVYLYLVHYCRPLVPERRSALFSRCVTCHGGTPR